MYTFLKAYYHVIDQSRKHKVYIQWFHTIGLLLGVISLQNKNNFSITCILGKYKQHRKLRKTKLLKPSEVPNPRIINKLLSDSHKENKTISLWYLANNFKIESHVWPSVILK